MKNQLNKILIVTFVILFFTLSKSYSIEDVTEFTDAINEAREEFSSASEASTEQSKIIDEALKEIDKATEYAQEAINKNNAEDAIKTLEFIEKTLADVESIIPQEFSSDMSKMDISTIPKEDMATITELTTQMKTGKEKKQKDYMSNLIEINLKGIDTASISQKLNDLGVNTIKLDLILDGEKKIETYTKKDWADSYTGSILVFDGKEVVADKDISLKVTELEGKFQKNTLKIEDKRNELSILNNQLNPINSELESLNEKQSLLTSQYNLEISKLSNQNLSNFKTQKSIELSEKLKNELENVASEVLKAEQKSSLLKTEIFSLNTNLNEQILQTNKLREDINNLNSNKLELSETMSLKTAKLNELKGQSPNLGSNSNITELTAKLEDSEKLKSELSNLQSQIQNKNLTVNQKISQISSLNTKLNPLADQINLLNDKKENLQKQYNAELTNMNNTFNLDDLSKSKGLAANLNSEINSVSSELKSLETNSTQIKTDISQINLEISTERAALTKISTELANSQKEFNSVNSIISSKESELDRLLNSDLAQTNQILNQQLNQVSLQKDFIESKFEKSIDLEVEALQRYYTALGDPKSKYFEQEIDFAMREVGVILDADPRKARAFELEKYATYAGLSNDVIQKGLDAVNKDDWDAQKNFFKDITKQLAKDPKWTVDIPTEAELRVMVAEEKAIQEAALASLNIETINKNWDAKLTEQAKEFQPLAGLNTSTIRYAATYEGMAEHAPLVAEIDKVLNANSDLKNLTAELEEKQKQLKEIQVFQQLKTQEVNNAIKPLQDQLSSEYSKMSDFNQEYNKISLEKNSYINSIGGYAALQRDKGNPNYGDWTNNISKLDQDLFDVNAKARDQMTKAQNISSEIYQIQINNATPTVDLNNWSNLQREVGTLSMEKVVTEANVVKGARSNLIAQVEEAKTKYNEIMSQENPEYTAVIEKVSSILNGVPTFEGKAGSLAGLDAVTLRAELQDLTNGTKNETAALEAARKAMSEMGEAPVSEFMTGPYWEMSNVKAAAIVRSKKYDYVDEYAYINAYYEDPLELSTVQRQEVETELKGILGDNNPKLSALNNQVNSLKSEINTNNTQLANITENISKLENEIGAIKSSEKNLNNQIAKLSKDLTSKQSLINGKSKSLTDFQKNLDPINNKISELETKKNSLNSNVQNQISLISQNTKKSEEIAQKTSELENKLSKEISEIDQQINGYKTETKNLTVNISTLNNEILNLEKEKPDLSNKISKINEELVTYSNVKAELSVLTGGQKAKVENIDIEINKLENELSNLKTSESQINQQLASLSNDLKSKEDIVKNNNLSISEIQNQIDPLNSQIETLENQKVSLDERFNKDFAELSKQVEQETVSKSSEIDKLKTDYEAQMSSLNKEINNFENKANELNLTVSDLNQEIKSIEVQSPQLSNQITKLNEEIKGFENVKANLAMATAKNVGLKVDEKAIKSLEKLDGKVIISIKGTELVRIIDQKMLKNQPAKFISPISKFSLNAKIYSAEAIKNEVFVVEEITTTYSKAKTVREEARVNLAAVEATPGASKAEIQAAEAVVNQAKYAEIAAGQSLVSSGKAASVIGQQATLENLRSIASTPGMNKFDVRRANAAVKALEDEIAGLKNSYTQASNKIANEEVKWNAMRLELYQKDINSLKSKGGNVREIANLERDMQTFVQQRQDEQIAYQAVSTKQSSFLQAINTVSTKTAALTGEVQAASQAAGVSTVSTSVSAQVARSTSVSAQAARSSVKNSASSSAYQSAKAARQQARTAWNEASAAGNKAAEAAAEAAWEAAKQTEIAASASVRASTAAVQQAAQEAGSAASAAAQEAASAATEAAAEVSEAVAEAVSGAQAAAEAAQASLQETLDQLNEIRQTPGMNKWDVRATEAKIAEVKAQMEAAK
jgi:chromosome segregation ATPase